MFLNLVLLSMPAAEISACCDCVVLPPGALSPALSPSIVFLYGHRQILIWSLTSVKKQLKFRCLPTHKHDKADQEFESCTCCTVCSSPLLESISLFTQKAEVICSCFSTKLLKISCVEKWLFLTLVPWASVLQILLLSYGALYSFSHYCHHSQWCTEMLKT